MMVEDEGGVGSDDSIVVHTQYQVFFVQVLR